MAESILNGRKIIAVDCGPDILEIVEKEILRVCPECKVDQATTYEETVKLLESKAYDVAILNIMGSRGFDLLHLAVNRNVKVALLPTQTLGPQTLQRACKRGACIYIPKEKLGDIASYLESILRDDYLPGVMFLAGKLVNFFERIFRSDWKMKSGMTTA